MTPLRVSVVAAIGAVVLIVIVLELVRRSRLHERYAILWLLTGAVVLVLSLWRSGLNAVADLLGVGYAPALLFAVGAFLILLVLLHYATVISRLADQNAVLAQKLALLQERLERAEPDDED